MPRWESLPVPEGWQIVERGDGFWAQRQRPGDGLWEDVAGPYTRRFTAFQKIARMVVQAGQQQPSHGPDDRPARG